MNLECLTSIAAEVLVDQSEISRCCGQDNAEARAAGHQRTGTDKDFAAVTRQPVRIPPIRILIVDDDTHGGLMLKTILLRMGAQSVEIATTTAAAIESFRCATPQMVITDQNLPDGLGTDLVHLIRAGTNPVPTILFSGTVDSETMAAATVAGADAVLAKPISPRLLQERIRALAVK
ncbi:MAG: response regulator [Azospirillaceae bacterium]|nr:response regulator [Azospirillaceae bacterium]